MNTNDSQEAPNRVGPSGASALLHGALVRVRESLGEVHFSPHVHPEWPQGWLSANLSEVIERDVLKSLERIAEKAVDRCKRVAPSTIKYELRYGLVKAVQKECKRILEAAKYPPKVRKWADELDAHRAEKRRQATELNREIRKLRDEVRTLQAAYRAVAHDAGVDAGVDYPPVPKAVCRAMHRDEDDNPIPDASGVYFVWTHMDGVVAYVGQSINLKSRATLSHERIKAGDALSWLTRPAYELDFVEAFYIGVCRPIRNFGKSAKILEAM